jgi:hypothetical protein
VTVSDVCDAHPTVTLSTVLVLGTGRARRNGTLVAGADFGTDDRMIQLRADRNGSRLGSGYAVGYRVADHSGNFNFGSALVNILHDQRH